MRHYLNIISAAVAVIMATGLIVGRCFITPRLDVPTAEGCFESFAHLYVGVIFGLWLVSNQSFYLRLFKPLWLCCWLVPSVFELVMFLLQKNGVLR